MSPNLPQQNENNEAERLPAAPSGNASNPSPQPDEAPPAGNNQLLNERAEKYLRESASIEDMPDEQDWAAADKILKSGTEPAG